MNWQNFFRGAIRVVFLFAYIAFMAASIRHVATFFHDFEQDQGDWVNPYTLAVSIDLTSLTLTIGVMFFRKNMPWYAQLITWFFVVALTGFSWFVNWEYARTYEGSALHTDDMLAFLNPILASSFAFLNLAYAVVAEFFNAKVETAEELQAELDRLEGTESLQNKLKSYRSRNKKPSFIQRAKDVAKEAKSAAKEVLHSDDRTAEDATIKTVNTGGASDDITLDPLIVTTFTVPPLNSVNVAPHNGGTVGVSRSAITDDITGDDDDAIVSSINDIAATVDLASLHLSQDALEVVKRYPGVYSSWLSLSVKSVTIPEIVAVTKQPKRRVSFQVGKALKTTSRNENKILVSSVIDWLRTAPLPEQMAVHSMPQKSHNTGGASGENVVRLSEYSPDDEHHKLSVTLEVMRENPDITDDELANLLGLARPASARYWKLKAQAFMENQQELVEQSMEFVNA
jgi:hypothetical protein